MYRQLTTYSKALGSILALFGMMIFGGGSCFLQKVQDKIWDATPPSPLPPPQGNSADTNKQENNTYAYSYEKTDINNQDERNDKSGYGNSDDDLETSDNESGYETTEDYIENNSHTPAPNYDGYYYSNSSPTTLLPEKENTSVTDLDPESNDQKKSNLEEKEEKEDLRKKREKKDTDKNNDEENDEDEKEDNAYVEIDNDDGKDNDENDKDNTISDDDNGKGNDDEEEDEHAEAGTAGSNADIARDDNNNNTDAIGNGQTKDKKKDVAGPASASIKNG